MPSSFAIDASVLAAVDDFRWWRKRWWKDSSMGCIAVRSSATARNFGVSTLCQWRQSALCGLESVGRTDEYYVKQFEDDTNVRCHIFLDTSGSMDFGAPEDEQIQLCENAGGGAGIPDGAAT